VLRAFLLSLAVLLPGNLRAQQSAVSGQSRIVARVDNEVITAADVDREIELAFPGRAVDSQAEPALRQRTTEQLIRRQLVLRYLIDSKQAATDADIDLALERLKKQLAQRDESFGQFLEARKLSEPGLRRALAWQIGWGRMLEKYLSEENLQRYFDKHRAEFDGTQLRVAHVLIPVDASADADIRSAAQSRAAEIVAQIRNQSISFTDAARKYSSGPSRELGGDIGLISRHEPMPEPFSKAAFALGLNQTSDPVETVFGIHIIRCLEIVPGQKQWSDVKPDLERAVAEYLFNWAAEQIRPKAKIEVVSGGP
jgi:parvulin-like peptidyl-prolyl isomerase